MTVQPVAPAPVRRLSKSSLISFICGILGCIPLVTGILAILLGIVGLMRTRNPMKSGRWMAVIGLLLGILSVGAWTVVCGTVGIGGLAIFSAVQAPKVATHDFIRDLAAGGLTAAKADAPGISEADIANWSQYVQAQGKFVDTTFTSINLNEGGGAHVEGTAEFSGGNTQDVKADLEHTKGGWKVDSIEIKPRR